MPKKTFTPEQIVGKLRQIEVLVNQGKTVPRGLPGSGNRGTDVLPLAEGIWRAAVGAGPETQGTGERKRPTAAGGGGTDRGKADPEGHRPGKLISPERRRQAVRHAREEGLSERHACRLVGQPRGTQRYQPTQRDDEDRLTQAIIAVASEYGRYGYRRITALLQQAGWQVGKDRVQRIWRREGLKVPAKQKPRGGLWLTDGSCIRLRPESPNHVWSYDFVEACTHDGRSLRLLTMIDEFTRECLAIRVARRLNSNHVIETLGECMLQHGVPEHVRSDNGAEMTARRVKEWLRTVGTRPLFIEPGSPWENATVNRSTGSCGMNV